MPPSCDTVRHFLEGGAEMTAASQRWQELEARVRALLDAGGYDACVTLVIERLGRDVLDYFRTALGEDEAQEALSHWRQEVWRFLRQFRWEGSLRGWGYQVAKRSLYRVLRRPYRHREEHLSSSAISRLGPVLGASRGSTSERERGLEMLRAQLEPEDQELLTLRVDRELEWEEVAGVLDSTPVALRKRYERLTKRLALMARNKGLID